MSGEVRYRLGYNKRGKYHAYYKKAECVNEFILDISAVIQNIPYKHEREKLGYGHSDGKECEFEFDHDLRAPPSLQLKIYSL